MNRITIRAVAVAILLCGCGPALRPDPNPYAMASNVPTAEIRACGSRAIGLKSCSVLRGEPLDSIKLSIQGYNSGTVRVTSDKCGLEFDARYSMSKEVEVPIPGNAQESCVVAISVQPEFPNERSSGIVIGSLKAFVRIRVIDADQQWTSFASKIQEGSDAFIDVDSPTSRVVIRGCDSQFDQEVQSIDGKIRLSLSMLPEKGISACAYEGVVVGEERSLYFTWFVFRHSKKYIPAPSPVVSFDGDNILIEGEQAVSVVSLDGSYVVSNAMSAKFDRSTPHVVRLLTVGGRNILGEYDPDGGFEWRR